MPYILTVPNEYGYVLLSATSSLMLNLVHALYTGSFRRPANVPYPHAYANETHLKGKPAEAYALNCAQRSHANFTEHHVNAIVGMLVAGLEYPVAAAALGAGWTVSRALYMTGYTSGGPETKGTGRYRGSAFWFCELGLIGMAAWVGVKMVGVV